MSTASDQPNRFDEHDLLGYVEGTLPAARADLVRRALAGDATLAARVEAMRADRAALADLVENRAPDGLVAAALGQLELGALLDHDPALRLARPEGGHAPAPTHADLEPTPGDPMLFARHARRRRVPWTPLVGVAAVLLLGVGVWTSGLVTLDLRGSSAPTGSLAMAPEFAESLELDDAIADPSAVDPSTTGLAGAIQQQTVESAPAPVASAPALAQADADAMARGIPDAPRGTRAKEAAERTPAATRSATAWRPIEVDAARAAQLATEGRLALRAVAGDVRDDALAARLGRATAAGRLARPEADASRDRVLAQAVIPAAEFAWPRDAFAGEGESTPPAGPRPAPQDVREPAAPTVLTIDTLADAAALERARAALGERAVFVELAEPTDLAAPLEPGEVLWWTLPPDRWSPRVRVPVVVYDAR